MRTSFLVLGFLGVASYLPAGQQTIRVEPQSLAGWSLVGVEANTLAEQSELTLPANAQLVRTFQARDVSVRLAVQPLIGESTENWPVLEIGTTALIFTRMGTTGKLVLVIGEQAPRELPLTFALDAEGRSAETLALSLSQLGSVVKVTTAKQEWNFPADEVVGTYQMVLSAGASLPLAIQHLEITVGVADRVAPSPASLFNLNSAVGV